MPVSQADKLIITNLAQLKSKYGAGGVNKVRAAVKKLMTADAKRGLTSVLLDLSDEEQMDEYGASAIPASKSADDRANKEAIDAIYAAHELPPSYVMLLGSIDVIPHVLLENPMRGPLDNPMNGDTDPNVPSDLPYACDAPYSTDIQNFTAPTRVVGRLPNVTGDTDPSYLIGLLDVASNYTPRPASEYNQFLGISAHVWRVSSEMSLDAVFGSHTGMKISPPDGPKWTATDAKRLVHFINCHGVDFDSNFYGQKGQSFPPAHSASWMASKIVEGTVLAAECCYGAQLYDPAESSNVEQMCMCNTYLGAKAYAVFGSSTIAYGPPDRNDLADLICQDFCLNLASGTSTGRAALQARLDYVFRSGAFLSPTDLKTLAQFNLMSDPSLAPVAAAPHTVIPVKKAKPKVALASVARHTRLNRRAGLIARAAAVSVYRLVAPKSAPGGKAVLSKMRKLAADFGIKEPDAIISYAISQAPAAPGVLGAVAKHALASIAAAAPGPRAIHTILEKRSPPSSAANIKLVRGVQAVEYDDGVEAKVFESR